MKELSFPSKNLEDTFMNGSPCSLYLEIIRQKEKYPIYNNGVYDKLKWPLPKKKCIPDCGLLYFYVCHSLRSGSDCVLVVWRRKECSIISSVYGLSYDIRVIEEGQYRRGCAGVSHSRSLYEIMKGFIE